MTILIVGATGATGKLLVKELLEKGEKVKAIVRSDEKLLDLSQKYKDNLTLISGSISQINETKLLEYVRGCDAIVSCLGHNINFKGIFTPPYRLVTKSIRKLSSVAKSYNSDKKVKIILMNTAGNVNKEAHEKVSIAHNIVLFLLRTFLPPQADNEQAAKFLQKQVGKNDSKLEWIVIRPDTLINEDKITKYEIHPSPIRSAIFDPGKTSRINVAHFITELILNDNLWNKWKEQMPVIYNK